MNRTMQNSDMQTRCSNNIHDQSSFVISSRGKSKFERKLYFLDINKTIQKTTIISKGKFYLSRSIRILITS